MRPYEVEIFDDTMTFVDHTLIETPKFNDDYLDPENNTVELLPEVTVAERYFIRIFKGSENHFGIIKTIKEKGDINQITYYPFMNLFDRDIMLDVDTMTGTLESFLASKISETFVSNADTYQNLCCLSVETSTSTSTWSLGIEADTDGSHYAKVNLFDDLILPAFQSYQVKIEFTPDVMNKQVIATISVNQSTTITIEADLPNIVDKTITIKNVKKEVNKDSIWNSKDYASSIIYYLHTDGTFDTNSETDRMSPVYESVDTVSTKTADEYAESIPKSLASDISTINSHNDDSPLTDEYKTKLAEAAAEINLYLDLGLLINTSGYVTNSGGTVITDTTFITTALTTYESSSDLATDAIAAAQSDFIESAHAKAESNFSKNNYENLIELEMMNDDSLINPADLQVGQIVNVIHNGVSRNSILSGRKVSDTTTLIFGLVRLELTKILKGRT